MSEDEHNAQADTQQRLQRLEQQVAQLAHQVQRLADGQTGTDGTTGCNAGGDRSPKSASTPRFYLRTSARGIPFFDGVAVQDSTPGASVSKASAPDVEPDAGLFGDLSSSGVDQWVRRIGVAMLLLGLAFMYRLSVEYGWMPPTIRIGFGFAVGAALGAGGWRIRAQRKRFSQLLLGASSVALYVTLYAAHDFYELLPHAVAFAAMTAVVVATFLFSHRKGDSALVVVAAIGGFSTPFLLSSGGNIGPMVAYNSLLVLGMTAIYVARGWRHLLALTTIGGWFVAGLATGLVALEHEGDLVKSLYAQAAIVVVWFAVGLVPALRAMMVTADRKIRDRFEKMWPAVAATAASTIFGTIATWVLWEAWNPLWPLVWAGLALAYGLGAHFANDRIPPSLVSSYRVVAVLFGALVLYEVVPTAADFALSISVLMCAVVFAAQRLSDRGLLCLAHCFSLVIGFWFLVQLRLALVVDGLPYLNADGIRSLAIIACFAVAYRVLDFGDVCLDDKGTEKRAYRLAAHVLLLFFLVIEPGGLEYGDIIATTAWGLYAVLMLTVGLITREREHQHIGLFVVVLTVYKLIFVDMQEVDPIWRVLLFLGFGAALLALSYFSPLLQPKDGPPEAGDL